MLYDVMSDAANQALVYKRHCGHRFEMPLEVLWQVGLFSNITAPNFKSSFCIQNKAIWYLPHKEHVQKIFGYFVKPN